MNRWDEDDFGAWLPIGTPYRRSLYQPLRNGIGTRNVWPSRPLPTPTAAVNNDDRKPAARRAARATVRRRNVITPLANLPSGSAGHLLALRQRQSQKTRHLQQQQQQQQQKQQQQKQLQETQSQWESGSTSSQMSAQSGGNTVTRSAESDSNNSRTLETSVGAPTLPQPSNANENVVDGILVGTADTIGRRPSMEDEMIVARHITAHYRKRIWLFGVLDGHGGAHASKFVATNWPRLLFSLLDSAGSCQARKVRLAIETSIDQCNDMLYRHLMHNAHDLNVGTTLCAVIIIDATDLYCVNVGDSRAIAIGRDGKLIGSLSKDHKPARADETRRIVELGGHVTNYDGVPRVMGNLAVSRALGDFPSTPYVTHKPDIVGPRQMRQVSTIVVCCDGVTDVLDNDNIVDIVGDRVHRSGAQSAAEAVRNSAYSHYSGDNISVLVAKIK